MASKKANAQANLDAAKEIFKAVNGISSLADQNTSKPHGWL